MQCKYNQYMHLIQLFTYPSASNICTTIFISDLGYKSVIITDSAISVRVFSISNRRRSPGLRTLRSLPAKGAS
jgi:hypothetical protein